MEGTWEKRLPVGCSLNRCTPHPWDKPAALAAPPPPVLERAISKGYAQALLDSPKLLANLCRKYFTKYDANSNNVLDLFELVALTQDLRDSLGIPFDVDAESNVRKSMSEFSDRQGESLNSFEFVLWFAEELRIDLSCCMDHLPIENTPLEKPLDRLPTECKPMAALFPEPSAITAPAALATCPGVATERPSVAPEMEPLATRPPAATVNRPGQFLDLSKSNESICVDVSAISGEPIVSELQLHRGDLVASVLQVALKVCGESAWNQGALVAKLLLEGEVKMPNDNLLSWPDKASVTLVWLRPEVYVGPSGAVTTGDVEEVKNLLALGVPVDWRDGMRLRTALMWAAAAGQKEVVKLLLDHGADPLARAMSATAEGIARANDQSEIADIIANHIICCS